MQDWYYYLIDTATGDYLYVDDAGAVAATSTPTPLQYSPDGWQDIAIGYDRDLDKMGVVRNFTVPFGFVLDGYTILKHIIYTYNSEREITLLITKRRLEYTPGVSYQQVYDDFYEGEIDLTSFKDDGQKISVKISEGGIAKKTQAGSSTQHELDMDINYLLVKMDGMDMNYSVQMTATEETYTLTTLVMYKAFLLTYLNTSSEQHRLYLAAFDVINQSYVAAPNYATNTNYFLQATGTVTVDFHFKLVAVASKNDPVSNSGTILIMLKNQAGTTLATLLNQTLSGTTHTVNVNIDSHTTIPIATSDKLFLVAEFNKSSSMTLTLDVEDSITNITYLAKTPQTIIRAKKISQVGRELTGRMTDGDEAAFNDTYISTKDNLVLTTGDNIRGIVSNIKTSFDDWLKCAKVLTRVGMVIKGGQIVTDDYVNFYNTASPLTIPRVKNVEVSDATPLRVNKIKIGHQLDGLEGVNGKYSINGTHQYSHINQVNKELTLVSPYGADPFVIENIRNNFEGKTTTDSNSDNKVYVLDIDLDNPEIIDGLTVYPLKRETYDSSTGVPSITTIFNVRLTPKRLFDLHRPYINSIFYGFDGEFLKFGPTEQNKDFSTTVSGVTIDENTDEEITEDDLLFLPYYLDLDAVEPVDLVNELIADPNKDFQFGVDCEGFIQKAGIQPDTQAAQAYKLLASPNTDILNIHTNAYK